MALKWWKNAATAPGGHHESLWTSMNRYVFSFDFNAYSGRLFRTAGPLYAKLRCPVEVWTWGSEMQRVDADRRRGRPRTSSTGTQSSSRYVGATPLTHFHAITADFTWLVVVLVANEGCVVLGMEYTLRPDLWYTFDGRLLHGVEVKKHSSVY